MSLIREIVDTSSAGGVVAPSQDARPGRALAAWIDDGELARLRGGGPARGRQTLDVALAARAPGVDQASLLAPWPESLADHAAALGATEGGKAMLASGWELALIVDARRLVAAQAVIVVDPPAPSTDPAVPPSGDLAALARLTLPLAPPATEIPARLDERSQAWVISSRSPNIRITGTFGGEVRPGVLGFGFLVAALPSFVSVAERDGRYVLCDGYHRIHRLIAAGITVLPVFVRSFAAGEPLLRAATLPETAYLGGRPPTLADYHDDGVAEDVWITPAATTIYVQAAPAGLASGQVA